MLPARPAPTPAQTSSSRWAADTAAQSGSAARAAHDSLRRGLTSGPPVPALIGTGGYYVEPTVFRGVNSMRIFQEEIFGPVVAVTTFAHEAEAIRIANDTLYGLGAGVWTRDGSRAFRMGRAIQAGRVWTNCYHQYPAHAAFGGYKASGVGRENHRMMLEHSTQTKCLLVSYDPNPLGFF